MLTNKIGGQLRSLNLKNNDTVAFVSDNGPTAAITFLAVSSAAIAAPLNPKYSKPEFSYYLKDLNAKVLLVEDHKHFKAREAASELKLEVINIARTNSNQLISLSKDGIELNAEEFKPNKTSDISLVLHTSGTTSKPKIVPLTVENIYSSAKNIASTLNLSNDDRYLNIMPLFHIHGLVAGILSTIVSRGTIICANGFDALSFYHLIEYFNPTWYSGVPTMHQMILSRSTRNQKIISASSIRFIRSSSASLPVKILHGLEKTFSCPVIEAYGMTEAAHQMTSNLLTPNGRKPGSVGVAAGPEVGVLTYTSKIVKKKGIGEVVIKGTNVFSGYKNNKEANKEGFIDGWFRTGDEGKIDKNGYLTITGRLKEIINRAGEKIMPKEIDEIILQHPDIEQAVAFSIPHNTLGEEVGLAIVLTDGVKMEENSVKRYFQDKIAKFKIPTRILFLDEIPKGSTGKLQRIGLATKLGL